jgi:hypothetical protein
MRKTDETHRTAKPPFAAGKCRLRQVNAVKRLKEWRMHDEI